jgi:hypothetical protein
LEEFAGWLDDNLMARNNIDDVAHYRKSLQTLNEDSGDQFYRYYRFLMLYAYFYTICLMFRYTSWHFYAFSGTNLLTSRHSASSLFSAVFVFQK